MFMQNNFALLSCLLLLPVHMEVVSIFSFDCMNGFFGMFCSQNIWILLFGMGLLTCFLQNYSYYQCFSYFSPIIASMAYLISPVVTQAMVMILGIEEFPGMQTVYGGFVIILSLFLVGKGESQASALLQSQIIEQKQNMMKKSKM